MNSKNIILLINACIWTGNKNNPFAEALVIEDQFITFIGNQDEVLNYLKLYNNYETIDAKHNFVCPGFIDCHLHFLQGGERLNSIKLGDCKSKEEFVKTIENYTKNLKKGEWIFGGDWDHYNWGGELPDRFLIDSVTPNNPIWINKRDWHTFLANTYALNLLGIDNNIADIEGGIIGRNENNILTGIFKELAISFIDNKIQKNEDNYELYLESATNYVLKNGITSVHNMSLPTEKISEFEFFENCDKNNKLRVRIYSSMSMNNIDYLITKIKKEKNKSLMFTYGGIKFFVDGSLGSHSAAFLEDYYDEKDKGTLVINKNNLLQQLSEADSNNLQIFIHAIGDRAVSTVLDTFENIQKDNGSKDRRWRIEHAQHINKEDTKRFTSNNVIASMQPSHLVDDSKIIEKLLGPKRINESYLLKTLLKNKVKMAFGSDWFVAPAEPILTINSAVNRGYKGIDYFKEEEITVEEALYASTLDAAFSIFEDHIKGSLEVGKLGDFVILDRNILKIDRNELIETKVLMTVIGGVIRFKENF